MSGNDNESGIVVYPPLPLPNAHKAEPPPSPRAERPAPDPSSGSSRPARGGANRKLAVIVGLAIVAGGAAAWLLQPLVAPDPRIAAATRRATEAEAAARAQKTRAETLEGSLDASVKAKQEIEAKLAVAQTAQAELAGNASDEATRRKTTEAVQAKLKQTGAGAVAITGDEVHLHIASAALFKPNDDALTDRGKAVLTKVAAALQALPEWQAWVQGHTDDQPIPVAKPAPAAPVAPAKKGVKPVAKPVVAPVPVVRFPTHWELSAARALAVVHYFQDVAKLDPARLAALAFGPYAPASKKDKAANRRIEIVMARRPAK
jgi:chemotaxis protein MotB